MMLEKAIDHHIFANPVVRGVEIMSNKYKSSKDIPSAVLADRLDQLSGSITKGDLSEFVMRIPAELDHCPDLVMSEASMRLRKTDSNRIATQNESEPLEGIAERIGLDCDACPSWDLLLSAIHRKLDSMKFELDAYRELIDAETVDDKEIF